MATARGEGDGNVVAVVAQPWAVDAAGRSLAASTSFTGDTVTLTVDHLQTGVTYPVLVDTSVLAGSALYDAGFSTEDRTAFERMSNGGDPADPAASSASCTGPADYCKLNDEEKAFCSKYGYYACYELRKDQQDADKLQSVLFTPFYNTQDVGYLDGTKANAFRHSFWTAAMTLTGKRKTTYHDEFLGFKYAIAHENHDYDSPNRHVSYNSRMDVHTDRVGANYAKSRLADEYLVMCRGMDDKSSTGHLVHHDPRSYSRTYGDELIWLYIHASYGHGRLVRHARNTCGWAYGNDGLGLHHYT